MKRLKRYRTSNGMTQADLAFKLGVSRTTITMWETTEQYPTVQKLIEIAQLFGVSVDELLEYEKTPTDKLSSKT